MDPKILCVNFVTMQHIQDCFHRTAYTLNFLGSAQWAKVSPNCFRIKTRKESLLKNHITQHHTLQKDFKCEQCSYVGASIERLRGVFIFLPRLPLVDPKDQSDLYFENC